MLLLYIGSRILATLAFVFAFWSDRKGVAAPRMIDSFLLYALSFIPFIGDLVFWIVMVGTYGKSFFKSAGIFLYKCSPRVAGSLVLLYILALFLFPGYPIIKALVYEPVPTPADPPTTSQLREDQYLLLCTQKPYGVSCLRGEDSR